MKDRSTPRNTLLIYLVFTLIGLGIGALLSHLVMRSSGDPTPIWTVIQIMALSLFGGFSLGHAIVIKNRDQP